MTAHTSPSALEHAAQDLEPEGGARAWCTVAGGFVIPNKEILISMLMPYILKAG